MSKQWPQGMRVRVGTEGVIAQETAENQQKMREKQKGRGEEVSDPDSYLLEGTTFIPPEFENTCLELLSIFGETAKSSKQMWGWLSLLPLTSCASLGKKSEYFGALYFSPAKWAQ